MKKHYVLSIAALAVVAALAMALAPEAYAVLSHLTPDAAGGMVLANLALAKELRVKRVGIGETIKANLAEINKVETSEARRAELLQANDKAFGDVEALKRQIDQIEKAADLESELDSQRGNLPPRRGASDDPKERREQAKRAVEAYFRFGYERLSDEARSFLQPGEDDRMNAAVKNALTHLRGMVKEDRDLSTATSGVVLPIEYWQSFEESMLEYGGMREAITIIRTDHGNQFTMPTVSDHANMADAEVGEASASSSVDPTFSSVNVPAYTYRSMTVASREMLTDNSFPLEAFLVGALSTRLARRLNERWTTGDGSSKPNGVVTASSSAGTMSSGSAITINDLTEIEHSVDPAYRKQGARWMFHDKLLRNLKRMVDSNGQPIWQPGIQVRGPDTIYGYPFTINQDVAQPTTAAGKPLLFGNFKKYIGRDVVGGASGPLLLRLVERYAEKAQIAFFLFSRHGGNLLDAGTDPIKHMVTGSPHSN